MKSFFLAVIVSSLTFGDCGSSFGAICDPNFTGVTDATEVGCGGLVCKVVLLARVCYQRVRCQPYFRLEWENFSFFTSQEVGFDGITKFFSKMLSHLTFDISRSSQLTLVTK